MGFLSGVGERLRRLLGWRGALPERIRDSVEAFQAATGVRFRDTSILARALTHRSFLGSDAGRMVRGSNERLEFLGDAVLELVVIEHLFNRYPDEREGHLTQMKSLLVSRSVLADCAESMQLGRYLLLSEAEREAGGGQRRSILADAFEAVLGAIYVDQGLPAAARFVERWLLSSEERILHDTDKQNFKSILQEKVQAQVRSHPRYRVISETGPDHRKHFRVEVLVCGAVVGTGEGRNKKEAEQHAARNALLSENLDVVLRQEAERREPEEG